jgi:ATP-dependent exoDNAse (exonuclease V) beta subunit
MTSQSSSGSDHSERSSIYWGSDDSESPEPVESRRHQHNASNAPRLSSPRLFQDFFSNTTRADARLPPVPPRNSYARPQDFPQAFENVNRAIQTAHQAFQNNQVVDLTNSPPRRSPSPRSPMSRNRGRRDASAYEYSSSPPAPSRTSSFRPGRPSELSAIRSTIASRNGSATEERAPKRRRIVHELDDTDDEAEETGRAAVTQEVEAVDLTEVNDATDLSKALSKQRQDAIQAQMKQNQGSEPAGRTPLTSYKCPICMDTPEDATTTTCGAFLLISVSN